MSRLIVKCPVCYENWGVVQSLAEYFPEEGILSISRSKGLIPGQKTIVLGSDYQLVCGNCKQVAFRKTPVLIQQTTTLLFGTA